MSTNAAASPNTWTYTFTHFIASPGYIVLINPISYNNISCALNESSTAIFERCTSSFSDNMQTQMNNIQLACQDSCQPVISEFSNCIGLSGGDGSLLTRVWYSMCMRDPNNSTDICLFDHLQLLSNHGANLTSMTQPLGSTIICDACTRISMQKMIENYAYLHDNPTFAFNIQNANVVEDAKTNIKQQCGKSYDQLSLDDPNTQIINNGIPGWAIALIVLSFFCIISVVSVGFYFLKLHRNTSRKMGTRKGNSGLAIGNHVEDNNNNSSLAHWNTFSNLNDWQLDGK